MWVTHSGGCVIGERPINFHLEALKQMGVEVEYLENDKVYLHTSNLKGADINLDFPSVGVTENIMLLAGFARGGTVIKNAAKEPEVVDLAEVLKKMGVEILGEGTGIIRINPVKKRLNNFEHTIIPDRIVASTYLLAGAITQGDILVKNINIENNLEEIKKLRDAGCNIKLYNGQVRLTVDNKLKSLPFIQTLPYPGFPTDSQAQFMSLMAVSDGKCIIRENVFKNRLNHIKELIKMGANIKLLKNDNLTDVLVSGCNRLVGCNIEAKDLRGGAALVLAGLVADGETSINGVQYIDRGYERFEQKLSELGAEIKRR